MAAAPANDPCYNIWLPFTPVGREQPSVEIVRGSHRRMRELPMPSPHNGTFSEEWVARYFAPTAYVAPELEPGDALIFDHWTLHRTQILDCDQIARTSIECRVTQQAAYLLALPAHCY
jgi:ectoine hydroxylase-related dioxygenase (phytanoyl-CoA dioxygenase family)